MKWKDCFRHLLYEGWVDMSTEWDICQCQVLGTPQSFPSFSWIIISPLDSGLCPWREFWVGCLPRLQCSQRAWLLPVSSQRESEKCSKDSKSAFLLLLEIDLPHQLSCGWLIPGEQWDQILVKIKSFLTLFMWLAQESELSRTGALSVDSRLVLPWFLALWLTSGARKLVFGQCEVMKSSLQRCGRRTKALLKIDTSFSYMPVIFSISNVF